MHRFRSLALLALVVLALPCLAAESTPQPPLDPNMPTNITNTRRSTLEHGLRLWKEGDQEFARGHFASAQLPKPCKVQLVMEGVPEAQREAFHRAALAGMALWGAALPEFVRFEESRSPEGCRALLFFVPTVLGMDEKTQRMKYVCGTTREDAPHDGLTVPHRATILVAVYQNGGRQLYSTDTITHVVAHELGHVIGIGELNDPKHIMGPNSARPSTTLSTEDIATARALLEYQRDLVTRYGAPAAVAPPPAVGRAAADFTATTLDGKALCLSDLRGKVVLLDFWATWCAPCRAELPNVVSVWNKYHDKGFEIVGVSLDGRVGSPAPTDQVKKFAGENGMAWSHVVEGKGWASDIGRLYYVNAIPFTCLIGRDGKILDTNVRGPALAPAVEKALVR